MELLIGKTVVIVCALALSVVPLYFIAHQVYQDGAWGRLGLAGIWFCAVGLLNELVLGSGDLDVLLRLAVGLLLAFTIFLCWHLYRFHYRQIRERARERAELEASTKKGAATVARFKAG